MSKKKEAESPLKSCLKQILSGINGGSSGGGVTEPVTKYVEGKQVSDKMSGLTSEAISYRETNSASITNRDEFAGKLANQKAAFETWDKYNPAAGILSGAKYVKAPLTSSQLKVMISR
ncbi:MAG: hypothetical protein K1X47_12370 [Cyclobacteriaceae bacterium]|nr:hypothetical protein [Cyclobacteriaceae bacterium]